MNILKILTDKRIKGNIGEAAVCRYLRRRLYRIRERNYVAGGHEIDVIAQRGRFLCFVEVKSRTESKMSEIEPRPASAVNAEKMRSIISAAQAYLSVRNNKKKIRFDVAEVYLDDEKNVARIEYLESAFTRDSAQRRK